MITLTTSLELEGVTGKQITDFLMTAGDEEYRRWWPGTHLRFHPLRDAGLQKGRVVYMDEWVGRRRVKMQGVVLDFVPGKRLTFQMRKGVRLPARLDLELTDTPRGVRLTHSIQAGGNGFARVLDPLLRLYFSGGFRQAMDLHARVEFTRLGDMLRRDAAGSVSGSRRSRGARLLQVDATGEALMRVLVTWGSKRGGTEGIARIIGDTLEAQGFDVDLVPARQALGATGFDAVVVGGALYANRWHAAARRFVSRRARELAHVPVWFFSSGPLDDSAARDVIPPTRQVETLMQRVGAQAHETFGGRLEAGAKGFPAAAMAKEHAGDWRSPDRIRSWAMSVADALPTARPGLVLEQPGGSVERLLAHGAAGWALCAAIMALLLAVTTTTVAVVVHAVFAPMVFAVVARRYFRPRGARNPLPTAFAFAGTVAVLDTVIVAGLFMRSAALLASFGGFWLPLALIFAATLATGAIMQTLPWPKPAEPAHGH